MEKFDFAALMQHELKTRIKVTRLTEPNTDKMAAAFFNLLKK